MRSNKVACRLIQGGGLHVIEAVGVPGHGVPGDKGRFGERQRRPHVRVERAARAELLEAVAEVDIPLLLGPPRTGAEVQHDVVRTRTAGGQGGGGRGGRRRVPRPAQRQEDASGGIRKLRERPLSRHLPQLPFPYDGLCLRIDGRKNVEHRSPSRRKRRTAAMGSLLSVWKS